LWGACLIPLSGLQHQLTHTVGVKLERTCREQKKTQLNMVFTVFFYFTLFWVTMPASSLSDAFSTSLHSGLQKSSKPPELNQNEISIRHLLHIKTLSGHGLCDCSNLTDESLEVTRECRHVLLLQAAARKQQAQQFAVALILLSQQVVPGKTQKQEG
jgi:hypothetical protein